MAFDKTNDNEIGSEMRAGNIKGVGRFNMKADGTDRFSFYRIRKLLLV